LGIHGRKGEGKTFQTELVFRRMGFEPVMISGGELESPDAGDPARLIRLRYREAAEQIRVRGEMCASLLTIWMLVLAGSILLLNILSILRWSMPL